MLEVHRQSGGFTPWNESCPGEHLSFGSFAIPLAQNLSHRSHAIPLGFTPWNSFSACLGGRNDHISVECLNLVHQGGVIPLGLYAPCSMLAVLLGFGHS